MKTSKKYLSAALAAAIFGSVSAYAVTAVEDGASSVESSDTSESSEVSNSDSNSGVTSNYLELHMSRGNGEAVHISGKLEYRDESDGTLNTCPTVGATARFHIPVGCSGTITINQSDYIIISIKIGNSTSKRDMTKVADNVYGFTIQEGDTDMYVIYEGDESEPESSAPVSSTPTPAPTTPARPAYTEPDDYDEPTTRESAPEADTNPDTGIALAIPAVLISAAAAVVASKKKK